MNMTNENTLFATIGAWNDWEEKTKILRSSARKNRVELEIIDKGERWYGYYENKIVRLKRWLENRLKEDGKIRYFVFVDARDVVFVKPKAYLFRKMNEFSERHVWFNLDRRMKTWTANARWFAHRIALKYGYDGIANSGMYFGSVRRVLDMLNRCMELSRFLTGEERRPGRIEQLVKETIRGTRPEMKFEIGKGDTTTTAYSIGTYIGAEPHLQSDQFYIQLLQAMWDDIVQVDVERKVLAGFADGWPTLSDGQSNGSMPLGTAGILHSPWMFPRTKIDETKNDWEDWARREKIV